MVRRFIKFFASLKVAVLLLAFLGALISVGTFVEARYDAWTAKNLVYASVWMYLNLGLLVLSLVAVIVDRWPWKPRHASFILAHIGIIFIIYGSLLTQLFGVDGTLRLPQSGESIKEVTVPETVISVYRSRTGESYEKVSTEEVNFLKKPIQANRPFLIKAKGLNFELVESIPYGLPRMKVEDSQDAQNGPALRFQLSNANVSQVEWLVQRNLFERAEKQIGPVLLTLGGLWERVAGINEIRLFQDEGRTLNYALYGKDHKTAFKKGVLREGDVVTTGWMGLELRNLRYLEKAVQKYDVETLKYPTPSSSPALRVRYNGQESYLVLNDHIKVFTEDWVYLVSYQNKRLPLGFEISLLDFKKTDYPGTKRAMAYESEVQYDDGQRSLISMNEPLKHQGYYLYQASFEQSPSGQVMASILSVNQDPGRRWKYMGSLVMCLGVVLLFYFRRRGKA